MNKKIGFSALAALVIAHVVGMIDLVALPVWVGALVERYEFSPQLAGGLATLFLLSATAASMVVAPKFVHLNQRLMASVGFTLASLAFFIAASQSAYPVLAALHMLAGVSVGVALSMVHGTISHSANPHRLYAIASIALGLFGIIFLGAVPQILIAFGGSALFIVFGSLMLLAALMCALFFQNPLEDLSQIEVKPFSRAVWLVILGISLMTFNQAMVFSFVEVIGGTRSFSQGQVQAVLIALGVVNFLVPAPLAAILQKRLNPHLVTQIGPVIQGLLALVVTISASYYLWAPATAMFAAVLIFTHTFGFGLLSHLDRTGRAASATPAMAMCGAGLGPVIGGALGQNFGFGALGVTALFISLIAVIIFTKAKNAV